jgi:hypothetical protein
LGLIVKNQSLFLCGKKINLFLINKKTYICEN